MSRRRYVVIDGKNYPLAELVRLSHEQTPPELQQPTLFDLREDSRPAFERDAATRYLEPSLFSLFEK